MATTAARGRAEGATRAPRLFPSASMTILLHCHPCRDRDCPRYDTRPVPRYLGSALPPRPGSARVGALRPRGRVPWDVCLPGGDGRGTGRHCLASTPRAVCHHRRLARPRVFRALAPRGPHSLGGGCGFPRHRTLPARGARRSCALPPGPGRTRALGEAVHAPLQHSARLRAIAAP